MNTRRLECAWMLREAAWALKRYADRIEAAVVAIDPAKQVKAEAAARTWADRARQRLAKFSAARRKYLGPIWQPAPEEPDWLVWRRDDQPKGNPWRAGTPPDDFDGYVDLFMRPGEILRKLAPPSWPPVGGYICKAWRPS